MKGVGIDTVEKNDYLYMAKCATCVFHEKDKCMENAWFLANHNEAKTMRFPCVYPNAWKTHVAQLAMYVMVHTRPNNYH